MSRGGLRRSTEPPCGRSQDGSGEWLRGGDDARRDFCDYPGVRATPWTYVLAGITLASLVAMYVLAFVMGAEPFPRALVIVAAIFACVGAAVGVRRSTGPPVPRAQDVVAGAAGCALVLTLYRGLGMPALVALAITAVLIGMVAAPTGPLDPRGQGAGYAGAFVGLVAPSVTLPSAWVVGAGAVAGLLCSVIGPAVLPGVGGRLGLVAFMASAAVYWVAAALGTDHDAVLLPEVAGLAHFAVVPIGGAGAAITWVLIQRRGWDFALASGLTTLVVCVGLHMASMGPLEPVLGAAWFGGTMVALTLPERLPSAGWVTAAGLMYGAYMLHFEGPLAGHVGVIGATGTIAVLIMMGARWAGTRTALLVASRMMRLQGRATA